MEHLARHEFKALAGDTSPETQRRRAQLAPHACTHGGCDQRFLTCSELNQHLVRHELRALAGDTSLEAQRRRAQLAPHACTHGGCDQRFVRSCDLTKHLATEKHLATVTHKPKAKDISAASYPCWRCHKTYSSISFVRKHLTDNTCAQLGSKATEPSNYDALLLSLRPKCPRCQKSLTTSAIIQKHLLKCDGTAAPIKPKLHPCPKCKKLFAQTYSVTIHLAEDRCTVPK
ncbi:hypothetical protein BKA62DRAFT_471084 [Auriculariales sp. MPI-PUGE-AT-0066]|nr:hypothetical protein BKA62DRAFT_471084 [Auriculariales sp. MPI-PUGE-AT-0066]